MVQQLRYAPREYGGLYLRLPKGARTFDPAGGAVDLDPMGTAGLEYHVKQYPPVEVDMPDISSGRPVPLLCTTVQGNPSTDRTWSGEWVEWRRAAGCDVFPKCPG